MREHAIANRNLDETSSAGSIHAHSIDVAHCRQRVSCLFPPVTCASHGGVARGYFAQELSQKDASVSGITTG
eukprot:776008-Alexandrium_andersonii.AAC.1